MHKILQAFYLMAAGSTHDELINQIQSLKAENEILRSFLPKRIDVAAAQRKRLVKYGQLVGSAIRHLVSIVLSRTFYRWLSAERDSGKAPKKKRGRSRTPNDTRNMIVKMADENDFWGYSRIMGELKKLAFPKIGRTTVQNILKEEGFDPTRGKDTWANFLRRHAETLWACDFLQAQVWTMRGKTDCFSSTWRCVLRGYHHRP